MIKKRLFSILMGTIFIALTTPPFILAQTAGGLDTLVMPRVNLGPPTVWTSSGGFTQDEQVSLQWRSGLFTLENLAQRLSEQQEVLAGQGTHVARFDLTRSSQTLLVEFSADSEDLSITGYRLTLWDAGLPVRIFEYPSEKSNPVVTILRYTATGLLQGLTVQNPDGETTHHSYQWRNGLIREERISQGDQREFRFFSDTGLVERILLYTNDTKRETREFFYMDGVLSQKVITTPANASRGLAETRETVRWNEQAQEVSRTVVRGELLVSETEYVYTRDLLVEELVRSGGQERRTLWEYSEDSVLTGKEVFMNGQLEQRTEYDGDQRVQRYYQDGREILRVHYADNQPVREEEIRNGQVTRTRIVAPRSIRQ